MARASAWAAATIALLTAAGCAPVEPSHSGPREPRRCFLPREVRNFTAVDSTTVHLRVGRDIYRVETFGVCPDLNWTNRMAIRTTGGSSMICVGSGLGVTILTRGPSGRRSCQVRSIRALTPEEVQGLRPRDRP
ncbi:MAG: hypothetical protein J7500_18495 [Sphingomonas sp.]|uniref:DUF6491 family protein n=1 Tax=Sphingomonas sp. TaxID=28214 RepID=UPI001B2E26D5|nr:DUF6491 family protein [Sphingomonas sp.]MBO9624701.1 hypothetical protein [Sphingomonas sp.]